MNFANKIAFMHDKFGETEEVCKNCPNFLRVFHGGKTVKKCKVYGMSHSIATDWSPNFKACGLFGQEHEEDWLYLQNRRIREKYWAELKGQMEIGGEHEK